MAGCKLRMKRMINMCSAERMSRVLPAAQGKVYIAKQPQFASTIQVPQWPSGNTKAIRDHFELLRA
jgi:hypothetical protein